MVIEHYTKAIKTKNCSHAFHSSIIEILRENKINEIVTDNKDIFCRIDNLRKKAIRLYEAKKTKNLNLDLGKIVEDFSDLLPLQISQSLQHHDESLGEASGLDAQDKKGFYKPLNEVCKRQQRRRISSPLTDINEAADTNKVSRNTLLGHIVEIADYHSGQDRIKSKRVADILKDNESKSNQITFEAAAYMKLRNNMGRTSYQDTRLLFKSQGHDIIPTWNNLRDYEKAITPIIEESDKFVKINYEQGIKITCMQMLKYYEMHNGPIQFSDYSLTCTIKESVDGSGSHPIYNQRENVETKNIIMGMFTILEIKFENNKQIIYKEPKPNSPFAHRPLFLVLGKETRENLMIKTNCTKEK